MARIRSYKPEIFTDSKTGNLSEFAFKLFLGLMTHCDDKGVICYDPDEFKAKIYPFRPPATVNKIRQAVAEELLGKGLIVLFEVDTKIFIWIKNFEKHQKVTHPGPETLKNFSPTIPTTTEIKDISRIFRRKPELSDLKEGRKEGKDRSGFDLKEGVGNNFKPPTPQEVEDYGKQIGYKLDGEKFCAFYGASGWMRGKTKITNWKQCVITWKKTEEKNGKTQGAVAGEPGKYAAFE